MNSMHKDSTVLRYSFLAKKKVLFALLMSIVIIIVSALLYANLLGYERIMPLSIEGEDILADGIDVFDDIEPFNMVDQFVEPTPTEIFDAKAVPQRINPFNQNLAFSLFTDDTVYLDIRPDGLFYFRC